MFRVFFCQINQDRLYCVIYLAANQIIQAIFYNFALSILKHSNQIKRILPI